MRVEKSEVATDFLRELIILNELDSLGLHRNSIIEQDSLTEKLNASDQFRQYLYKAQAEGLASKFTLPITSTSCPKDRRTADELAEEEQTRHDNEAKKNDVISRTPVKEAITRLMIEGLMTKDKSHFRIQAISIEKIQEMLILREAFDLAICLRLATGGGNWKPNRLEPMQLQMEEAKSKFHNAFPRDTQTLRRARFAFIMADASYHIELAHMAQLEMIIPLLRTVHTYPGASYIQQITEGDRNVIVQNLQAVIDEHAAWIREISSVRKATLSGLPIVIEGVWGKVEEHLLKTLERWYKDAKNENFSIHPDEVMLLSRIRKEKSGR